MLRLLKFKPFRKLKIVQRLLERKRAKKLRSESAAGDLDEVCSIDAAEAASGRSRGSSHESSGSDHGHESPSGHHTTAHDGAAAKSADTSAEQASMLGDHRSSNAGEPTAAEASDSSAKVGDGSLAVAAAVVSEVPFHVRVRQENATAGPLPNPFGDTAYKKRKKPNSSGSVGSRKSLLQRNRGSAAEDRLRESYRKTADETGDAPLETGWSRSSSCAAAAAAAEEAAAAAAAACTKSMQPMSTSNFVRSHRHSMPEARAAGAASRLQHLRRSFSRRTSSGGARYGELVSRPSDCSLAPDSAPSESNGIEEETEPRVTARQVAKVLRRSFRKSGKYLKDGAQLLSASGFGWAGGLGLAMSPAYSIPLRFGSINTTV